MTTNESLTWLFGDAFARRHEFEQAHRDKRWSKIIRLLRTDQRMIDSWGRLILHYNSLLKDPADGPAKVSADLKIAEYDFDAEIFDVFAEICAAVHLGQKGANEFEPLKAAGTQETPDFLCQFGGKRTAVEVKNLRVHRFPEKVMLDHYQDIALKRGISHPLTLVLHKSTRESLGRTEHSENDLRDVVERLMDFEPNVDHEITLPAGAVVRFRLEEGGDPRAEEAITLDQESIIIAAAMLEKIRRIVRKGLAQLYSDGFGPVERRVLAVRWELPFYDMLRPAGLGRVLKEDLGGVMRESARTAEILIFSDHSTELDTVAQ
jgi:hypothetical protein